MPAPPTPTTSGLLPAAPAPGASLQADAGTLRPMRAQARWTYRGVDRPFGATGVQIGYTNVLTQLALTDRGVAMRGLSPDGQQLASAAPVLLMTAALQAAGPDGLALNTGSAQA
ncbi:MAG TPA: hypothetical protein VJN44_21600 [Roseateles sp.]|nr:hypothetical protein [Roseateles sp.]